MKVRTELFFIVAGSVIYAISMTMIDPIELIPGSFLGIAVALHKLIGTPVGVVNLILNVPIMFLCARIFGRKILYYTIVIMIATSGLIDLFSVFAPEVIYMNGILLSLAGGAVMGVGAGLLLAAGGTMAGTTALARIINRRFSKISVGNSLIILDTVIILTGCALLHSTSALLYSVLYTVSCSKVIDLTMFLSEKAVARSKKELLLSKHNVRHTVL